MKKSLFLTVILCSLLISACKKDDPPEVPIQNYCMEFNGEGEYTRVDGFGIIGTSDFTLEAWIYIGGIEGPGNKIINKGLTSVGEPPNAGYSLRANYHGDNSVEFHIGDADGTSIRLMYLGLTTDKWYHVAGVRDGKDLYLYLDGQLVSSAQTETVFDVTTNLPLSIGAIYKGAASPTNEFMDGRIDEVRIWTKARAQSGINLLMNKSITSPQNSLLGAYNFNDTLQLFAMDASGNNYNGSIIGSKYTESPIVLYK